MCAGQGHDVLGALPDHPRRGDVTARLVELDPATPKPPGEPPPSAALLADGVSQRGRCHPTEFAGLLGQARRIAAADPGRFQRMLDRSTGYGYRI
jgi:hypothetical protein